MLGGGFSRGNGSGRDSTGDGTPLSSGRGTPALGQPSNLELAAGIPASARASRLSDTGSDRLSLATGTATTYAQSVAFSQAGTDNFVNRCVFMKRFQLIGKRCRADTLRGCVLLTWLYREIAQRYIPDLVDVEQDLLEIHHKVNLKDFPIYIPTRKLLIEYTGTSDV